jgi:UDP-glucose 4-epimerase
MIYGGHIMKSAVVTGGCGFIGSHLVDELLRLKIKVIAIDNLEVGRLSNLEHQSANPLLEIIEADICDAPLMKSIVTENDTVFHLGALADIVPSVQNPEKYFQANVNGTLSILEACRNKKARKIVYVASSSCYGLAKQIPTPETASIGPTYPYALSKWLGEEMVMHWSKLYNMSAISLRFFNIYGTRARTSGTYGAVFGVFLAQLLAGKPLTIVGDGEQTRDFTYVSDAVSALVAAANTDLSGEIFNIGSNNPTSINRLIELLGATKTINIPKRPGEPDCTFADTTKISKLLNWHPSVSIEEGVQKMLDNISYWQDAPVWTADKIEVATADWFTHLGSPK